MTHILIVGGTGMLKDVSCYFLSCGFTISLIARNIKGIEDIILNKKEEGYVNPLVLDYHNYDELKKKISIAIESHGPIQTTINWIHSSAAEAHLIISDILNFQNIPFRYYDIIGSSNLKSISDFIAIRRKGFEKFSNLLYRSIILGHIKKDDNTFRWLNHLEISNGVIDAIKSDSDMNIVGRIDR